MLATPENVPRHPSKSQAYSSETSHLHMATKCLGGSLSSSVTVFCVIFFFFLEEEKDIGTELCQRINQRADGNILMKSEKNGRQLLFCIAGFSENILLADFFFCRWKSSRDMSVLCSEGWSRVTRCCWSSDMWSYHPAHLADPARAFFVSPSSWARYMFIYLFIF